MKKTRKISTAQSPRGRSPVTRAIGLPGADASAGKFGNAGQAGDKAVAGHLLGADARQVAGGDSEEGTRLRLIEAAGQIFAEHGLKEARVRDICRLAGANIAAINYHFGGKKALYVASIRYWAQQADGKAQLQAAWDENLSAPDRLERFVRMQVNRWLNPDRPKWHRQLLAREMFDPTDVFDQMLEEEIKPLAEKLSTVVKMYLGDNVPREEVWMGAFSVIGQVMQYVHGRPVMDRLVKIDFTPQTLDRVARHVTDFAHAGLTAQAARLANGRKGER